MGLAALSHRLVKTELARGTLKTVRVAGWPLRQHIRIVQLKSAFALKAVNHFLELARRKIPHVRFLG
jgi:hypothetical protein